MKPLLTNSYPPLTATLPTCLLPITKFLTTKEQRTLVSLQLKIAKFWEWFSNAYDFDFLLSFFIDNHRIELKDHHQI